MASSTGAPWNIPYIEPTDLVRDYPDADEAQADAIAAALNVTKTAANVTSGAFAADRIGNLPASKITSGAFNADRIPNLNASKITAGVLNDARVRIKGIGPRVVYGQTTNTATTSSTSFQNTPLAIAITPSSATSKILVFATWMGSNTAGFTENASRYILARGTTQLREVMQSPSGDRLAHMSVIALDSPSTTSSVTYRIRFRTQFSNGSVTFNRSQNRTESTGASTIVAIEVAA